MNEDEDLELERIIRNCNNQEVDDTDYYWAEMSYNKNKEYGYDNERFSHIRTLYTESEMKYWYDNQVHDCMDGVNIQQDLYKKLR